MAERILININEIDCKIVSALIKVGVSRKDAELVSKSLIDAEACGVESHGLIRLKAYIDRITSGLINPMPNIKIKLNGAIATVDGDNGMGQIVTDYSTDKCIELAKKNGVGIIAIHNSNHFGVAGYYSSKIASEGCIGFAASMAGPTMAPFGGMELLLGTNPFSIAFPAKNQNFCIDMASSAVAKGKIRIYSKEKNLFH